MSNVLLQLSWISSIINLAFAIKKEGIISSNVIEQESDLKKKKHLSHSSKLSKTSSLSTKKPVDEKEPKSKKNHGGKKEPKSKKNHGGKEKPKGKKGKDVPSEKPTERNAGSKLKSKLTSKLTKSSLISNKKKSKLSSNKKTEEKGTKDNGQSKLFSSNSTSLLFDKFSKSSHLDGTKPLSNEGPIAPVTTPAVAPQTTPAVSPQTTPAVTPETTPAVTPLTTPAVTPGKAPMITPGKAPMITEGESLKPMSEVKENKLDGTTQEMGLPKIETPRIGKAPETKAPTGGLTDNLPKSAFDIPNVPEKEQFPKYDQSKESSSAIPRDMELDKAKKPVPDVKLPIMEGKPISTGSAANQQNYANKAAPRKNFFRFFQSMGKKFGIISNLSSDKSNLVEQQDKVCCDSSIQQGLPAVQSGIPIVQSGMPIVQSGIPVVQSSIPIVQSAMPTISTQCVPNPPVVAAPTSCDDSTNVSLPGGMVIETITKESRAEKDCGSSTNKSDVHLNDCGQVVGKNGKPLEQVGTTQIVTTAVDQKLKDIVSTPQGLLMDPKSEYNVTEKLLPIIKEGESS